jgi:hypothetical protein
VKKIIGLAGAEPSFLHRLMDYVNGRGEAEAFVCIEEEGLKEEVLRKEPEVLFCMENFARGINLPMQRIDFVPEQDGRKGIYQYQSAGVLYKEMRKFIWKEVPKRIGTNQEEQLIAVYSPLGRRGKTSFALAYAREHSFFYIGMEEYGIITNDFCTEGGLLYHIKNRKKDILSYLAGVMEDWEGVRVLGSPTLFTDIRELTGEDFVWFMNELRSQKNMPSIIMDFGSNCLIHLEVLDLFDQVYVPILSGMTEERKLQQFKSLLYEMNGRMENQIKEIMVPDLSWKNPDFMAQIRYMDGLCYE